MFTGCFRSRIYIHYVHRSCLFCLRHFFLSFFHWFIIVNKPEMPWTEFFAFYIISVRNKSKYFWKFIHHLILKASHTFSHNEVSLAYSYTLYWHKILYIYKYFDLLSCTDFYKNVDWYCNFKCQFKLLKIMFYIS